MHTPSWVLLLMPVASALAAELLAQHHMQWLAGRPGWMVQLRRILRGLCFQLARGKQLIADQRRLCW